MNILAFSNPFYSAYIHSDVLGKGIFLLLYGISIVTWVILIYKIWLTWGATRLARRFQASFISQKGNPLDVESSNVEKRGIPNPFLQLYTSLRQHTLEILNKNRRFGGEGHGAPTLSSTDIEVVEMHLMTTATAQTKLLEKNLYILSTVVSLAPFLGLLGTVWGILIFFSDLQMQQAAGSNHAVLGGISMALGTTVLGLLTAIPALIGYNYLKNLVADFSIDMEGFLYEMLASVEIQYRQVDGK